MGVLHTSSPFYFCVFFFLFSKRGLSSLDGRNGGEIAINRVQPFFPRWRERGGEAGRARFLSLLLSLEWKSLWLFISLQKTSFVFPFPLFFKKKSFLVQKLLLCFIPLFRFSHCVKMLAVCI